MLALAETPGGVWTERIDFDTSVAAYVLGERARDIRGLAFERLGHELPEAKSLLGTGRKAIPFSRTDPEDAANFAAGAADATLRLAGDLLPELAANDLDGVFREIDLPHLPVLARMEQYGLAVDREALAILGAELAELSEAAQAEVFSAVGHEFQIGSPQQLSHVLFEELELPRTRKTARGWTTDANALEPLRQAHPAVAAVLRWRELTKIRSTYVDTLPGQIHPVTGRVHTVFSQTTAATGRLSSNDPNLQNIPVRTEIGAAVRNAFIARDCGEDPLLLSLDYSQIELRILAHVSGDEELRRRLPPRARTSTARRPRTSSTSPRRRWTRRCGAARRSSTSACSTASRRSGSRSARASPATRRRSSSAPTSRPTRRSRTGATPSWPRRANAATPRR